MIQIEFLGTVKHDGQVYNKGRIDSFDQSFAEYMCKMGWAKAMDGSIETGERSTEAVAIDPNTLTQVQAQSEVKAIDRGGRD